MLSLLRSRPAEPKLEDHPTVRLVDALLRDALRAGASDLHVAPDGRGGAVARCRVDGMLADLRALSAGELPRVVARLKVLAGLSAFNTGEPQDGAFRFDAGGVVADVRLATIPVVGGERASLRFLDLAGAPRTLGALGLGAPELAALTSLSELPAGAVVVVGPCSSGKSTTLHALLREILARRGEWTHAATIEDPVELRLEGATQVEVDRARGLDFAGALVSLLRHDPQVLLVGETRDPQTARLAVEAAFTGHLLLTSLHVGSIDEVVPRLEILGVPRHLIDGALRASVSQRLLRRRCAAGPCDACRGTGWRGRFAIAEIAAHEAGAATRLGATFAEQARRAVAEGLTDEAEVRRVLGPECGA